MTSVVDDPMEKLQDEGSCSICLDFFRDPVTIDCGHNFCRACIADYCERGSVAGAALCPQCRAGFLLSSSRPNRELANIVESIEQLALRPSKGTREEALLLCEKHGKKLRLFCQDDGEPICLVCDKSREHRAHMVLPIEEAAHDYKEKVKIHRVLIMSGFERRRQALAEEEIHLLNQLEEEKQAMLKKLQANCYLLLGQSTELQNQISEMEWKCQQPAASLLKDVKNTLTRSFLTDEE